MKNINSECAAVLELIKLYIITAFVMGTLEQDANYAKLLLMRTVMASSCLQDIWL